MSTAPTLRCPSCKEPMVWDRNNPHRPFCSQRCRDQDLMAWANEEHRIAGDPHYDDLLSEDIPEQRN